MDRYKTEYEAQKKKTAKKRLKLVLIFVFVAVFTAEIAVLLTLTSIDRSFPIRVERALYDGWDLPQNEMQLQTTGRITDTAFIDTELEAVSRYVGKNYKDDELSRLASEYIDSLKACQRAASQHDPVSDPDAFWNAFSEPYGRRLRTIYKLYTGDYHFSLNKKQHVQEAAYVVAQGWLLCETDSLKFTKTQDGNTTAFEAYVQNGSGLGIEYLNFEVELLDASGKVKETSSVYVADVADGEEMHLKFISTSDKVVGYRIISETCKFREKEAESDES